MRDFILETLFNAKQAVSIESIIKRTKTDFREISPILANLADRKLIAKGLVFEAFYELKTDNDVADLNFTEQEL